MFCGLKKLLEKEMIIIIITEISFSEHQNFLPVTSSCVFQSFRCLQTLQLPNPGFARRMLIFHCRFFFFFVLLQDYKPEEDPALFQSVKTGRGPLSPEWKVPDPAAEQQQLSLRLRVLD